MDLGGAARASDQPIQRPSAEPLSSSRSGTRRWGRAGTRPGCGCSGGSPGDTRRRSRHTAPTAPCPAAAGGSARRRTAPRPERPAALLRVRPRLRPPRKTRSKTTTTTTTSWMRRRRKQETEGKAEAVDASWVGHVVYCNDKRLNITTF